MSKRSNSNITRNKSLKQPLNDTQIKALWANKPVKKLRTFNHSNNNMHGKIVIDKHTVVEYDYSKDNPVTNIKKLNSTTDQSKNSFVIPKYPILKAIVEEIPKNNDNKEMELYLVKDMNQAVIWKNNEFEYHT